MLPLWLVQMQVQTTHKGQQFGRMLYNELEQGDILSGIRFGWHSERTRISSCVQFGLDTEFARLQYGRLRLSHHPKEDSDVLPPPCHRMDNGHPGPLAPLEQTASHRLGPVEPGDGTGSLLCVDRRQCLPGDLAGPQRARRVPAVARVLLRGCRQTRRL